MVRPLLPVTMFHQSLCFSPNHAITLIFAFMSVFTLISILAFMCASHKNIKAFKPQKSFPSKFPGFIGVSGKALLKMVSWQRVQHEEEEEEEDGDVVDKEVIDEDVVWRKTIIMGGRCRPLEFSGKIEYDCEGNPLPVGDDAKPAKKI